MRLATKTWKSISPSHCSSTRRPPAGCWQGFPVTGPTPVSTLCGEADVPMRPASGESSAARTATEC